MDFISQYVLASSGTAIPIRFTRWCAISILATTLGRKVYVDHAHYRLFPGIFICLVGEPASKKNTAIDKAKNMFSACFPDYPKGVAITSREDIVKFMSSDFCLRTYTNEKGDVTEWRPLANFIYEFTNFISFNPKGMIEFLTAVFDVEDYESSTIKRGREFIGHPFLSILAGTVPQEIVKLFKISVLGSGFSRRIIFPYETKLPEKVTFPTKSPEAYQAEAWCKEHLLKVDKLVGPFLWTDEARSTLDKWYRAIPTSTDPVLAGYYESKDGIVQKVAMCLAAAEPEPVLMFTTQNITRAIAFLEANEDNLYRLTMAVGRNELALPQARLLSILVDRGGMIPEKEWHRIAAADMYEMEYMSTKRYLKDTDQIVEVPVPINGAFVSMLYTKERFDEAVLKGEIVRK